jgi:hypothetical protein
VVARKEDAELKRLGAQQAGHECNGRPFSAASNFDSVVEVLSEFSRSDGHRHHSAALQYLVRCQRSETGSSELHRQTTPGAGSRT